MEPCPYCASPIPSSYLVEGGICDDCGQLILGEDDLIEDEPTNMLLQDDLPTDETTMGGVMRPQRPIKPMYELQMDEDFGVQIDRLTQSLPAHAMGETQDSVEQQKDLTVNIAVPGKRRKERGGKGPLIIGGGLLFSMLALGWFAHQNPNQEFRRFTGISIFFPDQDRHVDAMTIEEKKEEVKKKTRRRRRRSNQAANQVAENGSNGANSGSSGSGAPVAPASVDDLSALLMPSVSANTIGSDSIGGSAANTDDQVSREFQIKLGQFKICHARASKTYGNIRGRWKIKVNVNADGSISNFSVRPERESNEMLESCIQDKGERWTFTAPGSTIPLETTLIYN